ncbi:MAG: pentapeptide repeat-containing protein, partial [Acidobacteriota bacterium]
MASKHSPGLVRNLNLDACQMSGEDLEGIGLEEASAVEANFETAELRESRFLDCDFTRGKFAG